MFARRAASPSPGWRGGRRGVESEERLRRIGSTRRVVVAWALAATCLIGHAAHAFHHSAPWLKVLLGAMPRALRVRYSDGRVLVDGWRSLRAVDRT